MHDGQNLFNASTSAFGVAWMCQDTVNALIVEGLMQEIIIVGVYNPDGQRTNQYTYSYDKSVGAGGQGNTYLDWLYQTMLPQVKQWYPRAKYERENLGMLGSSLGGLLSCYACWTRYPHYSKCGCMSSSFWWNKQDFNNTVLVDVLPPVGLKDGISTVYLDSGNAGPGKVGFGLSAFARG
jgi:predicted alpha/beta superfamily hydrolase